MIQSPTFSIGVQSSTLETYPDFPRPFSSPFRINLPEQPRNLPPRIRMHRQHVDDVGPVVASLVTVAEQAAVAHLPGVVAHKLAPTKPQTSSNQMTRALTASQ